MVFQSGWEMTSEKRYGSLKDVVAFVDVWSSSRTENYSKPFIQHLQEMGAEVSKTFDKQVTHVIFKNGHQSTWNKAKKMGVKLVSVLWVARCKESADHIDEELCPAINEGSPRNPALSKRTHRCMQPRDIPVRTPENNKSMKRKLDQMMKSLTMSSPSSPDVSPFLIDEASGIVYSPSSRRASDMAQRLKVMREKRESLSRTDSYDADDSSDLDQSFSDFRGCSGSNKSEEEGQHSHKTPPFHFAACRSNIEINGSATEFLSQTDSKKQETINYQAKKDAVERSWPQGLLREAKQPKPQNLSDSCVQSNAFECETSLGSPCVDALFGEGAIAQSPTGLSSRDIRMRRKSSFKCDRAEKARSQSPCVLKPLGKSKMGSPAETQHVLHPVANDPCGGEKVSKDHTLFRDCAGSESLPTSVNSPLIRKAAVGVRKRDRSRKEQASPLEAFCRRKGALLAPAVRGSPELPRVSTPTDVGEFENYFSPTNQNGLRRQSRLLSLPSEPITLPPIEEEPKQRMRKRGRSEAGSPGPARGKRRML